MNRRSIPKETVVSKEQAPKRLQFQLVREVAGQREPVVVKQTTVNRTDEIKFFPRMKPLPRGYFIKSVIKREFEVRKFILGIIPHGTKTKTEYLVRCNLYWAETLESMKEHVPKFSKELANLLLADDMKQHIEGVADIQKFVLDSTVLKLIVIVFAISIPFGFLMDTVLNLVPHQVVNWQP